MLPERRLPPPDAAEPLRRRGRGQSNVVRLSAQMRRWRNVATFTTAHRGRTGRDDRGRRLSAGPCFPKAFAPSRGPRSVEVKTPPAQSPPSAQYVAVLQKDGGSPAFILTVDGATRNFTVRRVGAPPEPGKSYELWLISDKLSRPRSLGVIGGDDFTARPVLAAYDTDIVNNATYAVTVEQDGGSPDGNPHSAPVYAGKLIETVPQAAPAK